MPAERRVFVPLENLFSSLACELLFVFDACELSQGIDKVYVEKINDSHVKLYKSKEDFDQRQNPIQCDMGSRISLIEIALRRPM